MEAERSEQQTTKGGWKIGVGDCSSKEAGTKTCCEEDFVLYQDQVERGNCFKVAIYRELVEDRSAHICCGSRLLKEEKETL